MLSGCVGPVFGTSETRGETDEVSLNEVLLCRRMFSTQIAFLVWAVLTPLHNSDWRIR